MERFNELIVFFSATCYNVSFQLKMSGKTNTFDTDNTSKKVKSYKPYKTGFVIIDVRLSWQNNKQKIQKRYFIIN
jgi:hypothetical protein